MPENELVRPPRKLSTLSTGRPAAVIGVAAAASRTRAVVPVPMMNHFLAVRVVSTRGAHSTFQVLGRRHRPAKPAMASTLTPPPRST